MPVELGKIHRSLDVHLPVRQCPVQRCPIQTEQPRTIPGQASRTHQRHPTHRQLRGSVSWKVGLWAVLAGAASRSVSFTPPTAASVLTDHRFTLFIQRMAMYAVSNVMNEIPAAPSYRDFSGFQRDKVGGWLANAPWDQVRRAMSREYKATTYFDVGSHGGAAGG